MALIRRPSFQSAWLRALPLGLLGVLLGILTIGGALHLTLTTALLLGLLLPAGMLARGHRVLALVLAVALLPLAVPLARDVLHTLPALQALPAGTALRIEGTVRDRWTAPEDADGPAVRVLLGEVTLWEGARARSLAELLVDLPARSAWSFRSRRVLVAGGALLALDRTRGRPLLRLRAVQHHFREPPLAENGAETLRLRLRDRAAYYLGPEALAVYLPVLLGVRERGTPEAREVVQAFRDVGVAHLFAISGLHVGLLYLCFLTALNLLRRPLLRGQGSVHGPARTRLLAMALVWAYIALIGFPLPALRAALMGSMLLWSGLWGTRTPRPYILALAALLLLAWAPTQIYDLSFQLSFLAYLFLIAALALWPRWRLREDAAPWRRGLLRSADLAGLSLWVTLFVTGGLLPVVAETFGRLSLLVFLGNLLMIPLLTYAVLPLGLAALLVSLAHLGAAPGGALEQGLFAAVEALFGTWAALAGWLAERGAAWVLDIPGGWGARLHALYYLAAAFPLGWAFLRRRAGGALWNS